MQNPDAQTSLPSDGISLNARAEDASTDMDTNTRERHSHPDTKGDNSVAISEHESLKYHLLGPSLTKAGQDSVDQQKVSEIIYNASKGSKYFNNEEVKDKILTRKIERILEKKRQLERLDLSADLRRADEYITELELSRDLSQTIVHVDCDAFYAAVEELDRPDLKDVPFAVGKGVLTTCNYHARKFGCRSGMAGFVATKLCPHLIQLPLNFEKYTAKAQEVREILADYDPRFESASIDEAYLNITEYCQEKDMDSSDVVAQIRHEVAERTKITISAGIAANAKIAKIASNKNKPNGQFLVPSNRAAILVFMRDLPTRKVNGVGRVFERELDAIGIKTCGDIYTQRASLTKLFGEKAFQFLIQCYLGLGRTKVQPAEEFERKSVGTESTFRDMEGPVVLREKLRSTAEELEKDLNRTQFKGKTLVLKVKLHTYEVLTRQIAPPKAVATADDIYKYALPMLTKLEKEIPKFKLRLMGLRCSHLISTKKVGTDFFGIGKPTASTNEHKLAQEGPHGDVDGENEWEVWPEAEFEEAARLEKQEEMNEIERLSQESPPEDNEPRYKHGREVLPNPRRPDRDKPQVELWDCPICGRPQGANDIAFNSHIDDCLSKKAIKEAVQATVPQSEPPSLLPKSSVPRGRGGKRKLDLSRQASRPLQEAKKQRPFFG